MLISNNQLVKTAVNKMFEQSKHDLHKSTGSLQYVITILENFLIQSLNGTDIREELEMIVEKWPEINNVQQ